MNQRCVGKLVVLICAVLTFSAGVQAQRVVLVMGEVDGPPALKSQKEKARLRARETVAVPDGSLVILEYRWPSNVQGHACIVWDFIKGPATAQVDFKKLPGTCPVEKNPKDCNSPECVSTNQVYFYDPGKAESQNVSPVVSASIKQLNAFSAAVNKIKKQRDQVPSDGPVLKPRE